MARRLGPHAGTRPRRQPCSCGAALDSYAAPTLHSLKIGVSEVDRCDVRAHLISWLRFASQRVHGKLSLRVDLKEDFRKWWECDIEEELPLPICERATKIKFILTQFVVRPPPTGSFSALADLTISCGQMDGGELGRVVSSVQCPCLRKLCVSVLMLEPSRDISIRSESLEFLCYSAMETGKLEVHARVLKDKVSASTEARIVAPKLENVEWLAPYDPRRHQFAVAGHHLKSLSIMHSTYYSILLSSTWLMERFDTVSELTVELSLETPSCTMSGCPCLLPENHRLDDITFESLEEIGISFFTGSAEQVEFVELLLSRCNTVTTLKRVDFTLLFVPDSSEIMEVVQRIRGMCHPNSKVQFNVNDRKVPEPQDRGRSCAILGSY